MNLQQRKICCRFCLATCALMPISTILLWAFDSSPAPDWSAVFSRAAGWDVSIEKTIPLKEQATLLGNLKVSSPQLGTAARASQLELLEKADRYSVLIDHLEIDTVLCSLLLRDLMENVLGKHALEVDSINATLNRVTLTSLNSKQGAAFDPSATSSSFQQTLDEVSIEVTKDESRRRVAISFAPSGTGPERRCEFELIYQWPFLERERTASSDSNSSSDTENRLLKPAIEWKLVTGDAGVDCRLLRPFSDRLNCLGENASFSGHIIARESAAGMTLDLVGRFTHVDLYTLVSRPLHHTIHGEVSVEIRQCQIEGGKIIAMAGSIIGQHGQIERRMIEAGMLNFGWELGSELPHDQLAYRDLCLHFATDGEQLTINGSAEHAGRVLADANGNGLLFDSRQPQVPTQQLLRFLLPDSNVEVPLSRETAGLANLLPLPSSRRLGSTSSGASNLQLED